MVLLVKLLVQGVFFLPALLSRYVLVCGVRFYQMWVSPHKGYQCACHTHLGEASCSAHALQVLNTKPLLEAIVLIRQRSHKCRNVSKTLGFSYKTTFLKHGLFAVGLIALTGCGGGGSGNSDSSSGGSTTTTLKDNVTLVDNTTSQQITNTAETADGRTQLDITGTLGSSLNTDGILFIPPGIDSRFPFGLSGKVDEVTQNAGSSSVTLSPATLADVASEVSLPSEEIPLTTDNFIGVIAPDAFQPSASAEVAAAKALQIVDANGSTPKVISALGGGVILKDYRDGNTTSSKTAKKEGAEFSTTLGLTAKLAEFGLDPNAWQPYGSKADAKVDVQGSLKNCKLIPQIEYSAYYAGITSMDYQVKCDISASAKISGGIKFTAGAYIKAWDDVQKKSLGMSGVSAKFTGLDSKDKIGKIPVVGLAFSVPCPTPLTNPGACTFLSKRTTTLLNVTKQGGVIVWVYMNAKGELTLDGSIGAQLNGRINLGLSQPEGGFLDDTIALTNIGLAGPDGSTHLLEVPVFEGKVNANVDAGISLAVDGFVLGVRPINIEGKAITHIALNLEGKRTLWADQLTGPWTWEGSACSTVSWGAGLIGSANINVGAEVKTLFSKLEGSWAYSGQRPKQKDIDEAPEGKLIDYWWYKGLTRSECYPQPTVTSVTNAIIKPEGDLLLQVTIEGSNLPDDLQFSTNPTLTCTAWDSNTSEKQVFTCEISSPGAAISYNLTSVKAQNLDISQVKDNLNYGKLLAKTITGKAAYKSATAKSAARAISITPASCKVKGFDFGDVANISGVVAYDLQIFNKQNNASAWARSCLTDTDGNINYNYGSDFLQTLESRGVDLANFYMVITVGSSSKGTPVVIRKDDVTMDFDVGNITVSGKVTPTATGKLNDTGITTCSNSSQNGQPCPLLDYPGQDGDSGRDVTANDDSDGHAGFSFTKISSTGAELPASATEWSCVQDNVTGLMWEVKTDDGGLHDKDWDYSWYEPDGTKNGGNAGTQNGGSCGGTSQCDTYGFVQAVNAAGWCGAQDWRMPSKEELRSIVRYDRTYQTIDTTYFPNTPSSGFLSASPVGIGNYAWGISFSYGIDQAHYKNNAFQVRLVRSGQ